MQEKTKELLSNRKRNKQTEIGDMYLEKGRKEERALRRKRERKKKRENIGKQKKEKSKKRRRKKGGGGGGGEINKKRYEIQTLPKITKN